MNGALRKLEHAVEREMRLLEPLRTPRPSAGCVAQVQATVRAEAGRLGGRRRTWGRAARLGGIAAALLLALGLSWRAPVVERAGVSADADQYLTAWSDAVEESSDRVTVLLTEAWSPGDTDRPADEQAQFEDIFRALDESLGIGT